MPSLFRSKWFWIGLVILGILVYAAAGEWSKINEYKKQATKLQAENNAMKDAAKIKESDYLSRLNSYSQQALAVTKQLVNLQKENQTLIQKNAELVKKSLELEKKYVDLELRLKGIKVPDSRSDRVKLLNQLGY